MSMGFDRRKAIAGKKSYMKGRNTVSLKTKIKNDMWKVNYVVPFIKKHQFDEKAKLICCGMWLRHIQALRLSRRVVSEL